MVFAIYSRKSVFTGKGDSIENQIEFCKEYVYKNYPDKNIKESDFKIYPDEGYSGRNTNRPYFKKLLEDAENKKIDCVVCYRLDRISRSVLDFSALIQKLNKLDISFVSIKEQFDTSTPMGRAMMYISSVFAQLERETTAERVKDNMYELAKQGRWLGGHPPYGFDFKKIIYYDEQMKQRKMCQLTVNEEQMKIAKEVFEKYLEYNSIGRVVTYLNEKGVKGARGGEICSRNVQSILRSPAYVKTSNEVFIYLKDKGCFVAGIPDNMHGSLLYAKKSQSPIVAIARHEGVIESDKWLKVQEILDKNAEKAPRAGTGKVALLSNLLVCGKCKSNMILNYKSNSDIVYYVCSKRKRQGKKTCDCSILRTDKIDKLVLDHIKKVDVKKIIEEYNNIKESNTEEKKLVELEVKNKKKKIKDLELQVNNLVNQLANFSNSTASTYIIEKIEELNKEITDIKFEIDKLDIDKISISKDDLNLDILIDNIKKFNSSLDNLELSQQRLLLSSIIKNVIWNDEENSLEINYLGLENIDNYGKKSHFCNDK